MKQFSKYLALVLMSMVLVSSCGKKDEPKKPEPTPAPIPEKPKPKPEKPEKPEKPQDLSKFNALAFVAEYDVNKAGTGFMAHHNFSTSKEYAKWQDWNPGLFTWDEAKALFKKDFLKDYVLPSKEQWYSIIKNDNIFFKEEHSKVSVEEKNIVIGNEPKQTYQSEFITKSFSVMTGSGYVTYAIRFKGTKWESAWAYYLGNKGQSVRIRCLGGLKGSDKTLEEIATPAFFEDKSKKFVTRIFPFYGFRHKVSIYKGGKESYYWSSTPESKIDAYFANFNSKRSFITFHEHQYGLAVRPFKKTL